MAQVDTGTIAGTIRDSSESVIAGASITIRSETTGVETKVATNSLGQYVSPPIQPGLHTITAEMTGFRRTSTQVTLELNRRLVVDLQLQLGSVEQAVTVTSEAPLLESETSTLGNLRTSQAVRDLPLNGRNFAMLLGLTTGVIPAQTQRAGPPLTARRGETANSSNGMGFRANRFLVDGLDNTENHNGQGILIHPPVEAIQEIGIQTSVPSAEFGRGGANVNVRLRSGGRELHGTLFEFHRNAALDAKNFFDSPTLKIPPFIQNQFGFVVGGPVSVGGYNKSRDRTFFFADYEGLRNRQAQTFVSTVPLSAMKQGDFSGHPNRIYDPNTTRRVGTGFVRDPYPGNSIPTSQHDRVGRNILALFPDPNAAGVANNFLLNSSQPADSNNYDVKIDHRFGDHDNAFFRFSQHDYDQNAPGALPPPLWGSTDAGLSRHPLHQFVMSWTRVFSPTITNEARAGVGRLLIDARNANYGVNVAEQVGIPGINGGNDPLRSGLPQMAISGLPTIGDSGFRPAVIVSENWQYSDNLSWFRAGHTLKFGGEFLRRRYNLLQTTAAHGIYNMTGVFTQNLAAPAGTGNGIADLLLGVPTSGNINSLAGMRGFRRSELSLYVQDNWKIARNLTLNLGLRWEAYPGWPYVEVYDRQANFLPHRGDVFAVNTPDLPERSAAKLDGNNFGPRAGLAYRLGNRTAFRVAYGIFYQAEPVPETNLPGVNPPFTGSAGFNNDQADFGGSRKLNQGFPLANVTLFPTAGAALFTNEHAFSIPYAQQWNASVQHQLPMDTLLSVSYVGTKGTGLILAPDINQPRPGPGAVPPRRPFPIFNTIREVSSSGSSNYHSLQASFEKRMSSNLGFQLCYTWAHAIDHGNFIAGRQNLYDLRSERGNGDYDLRHRFTGAWSYNLPIGRGQRWGGNIHRTTDAFIGGWQINSIASLYSGFPLTVSTTINTLNGSGSQRADRLRNGTLSKGERSLQRWFDSTAFAVPGLYEFGNSGVGILNGPGTVQFDFSAFKKLLLDTDGHKRFEFRGEMFNIFNTPQFNNPATGIGNVNVGRISSAGSKSSLQRTSRQIQLALKFYF